LLQKAQCTHTFDETTQTFGKINLVFASKKAKGNKLAFAQE